MTSRSSGEAAKVTGVHLLALVVMGWVSVIQVTLSVLPKVKSTIDGSSAPEARPAGNNAPTSATSAPSNTIRPLRLLNTCNSLISPAAPNPSVGYVTFARCGLNSQLR